MRAAILGVTGYTGMILSRLLARHPDTREIVAVSSTQEGKRLTEVDPGLDTSVEAKMAATGGLLVSVERARELEPDVVFSALPHLESSRVCAPFADRSVIIDLSADLRLKDRATFRAAYGQEIEATGLLGKAVYGLAEWNRSALRGASVVANPGCYPTASLLPVLPLARDGIIRGPVIINAGSGISGAGRKTTLSNLFVERSESYGAYSPGTSHRHWSEIAECLGGARAGLDVLFTPHLVPMRRGIAATTVVGLSADPAGVRRSLEAAYSACPFVRLVGERIPQTSDVWGSNRCDIGWRVEGAHLMLFSAIDNLVKGASGQAVQCMNIRFGLDEAAGLDRGGLL